MTSRDQSSASTTQVNRDRGSSFASELERDRKHRERARNVQPLRRLLPFVLAYPGTLFWFAVFLFLASALTLVLPLAFRLVVDCGFGDGVGELTSCDILPANAGLSTHFLLGIGLAAALGITSGMRFFFISKLGERVVADLRSRVYDHLVGLSPGFYAQTQTGEVLSRLTTDTTLIQTLVGSSISVALRTVVTTLGALIAMLLTSWQLSLMVLVIGPAIMVPLVLFGRRMQRLSRDSQDRLAEASARASETLRAIETVQAFTQETRERANFALAVERTFQTAMTRIRVRSMMTAALFSFVLIALILILWFGATQVQAGIISPGAMTQFVVYAIVAVSGGGLLTETYAEVMRAAGATERLMELLASNSDVEQPEDPQQVLAKAPGLKMEQVHFAYPSRPDAQVLGGVDLVIEPGQTVAIVGPSGAGKSTLFGLFARFYDPSSGAIYLGDQEISQLDLTQLRQQLSIVQQNAPLFAGSAADNIAFGKPDASREEIEAAARAAYAHEFIQALPQGYDTALGEGAFTLSGGQRQRLAIARAILRDAPILLLDEATSALDSESEAAIQRAFEDFSRDRTTVVIAHRLSTVRGADKIVVMDQGQVLDQGTHDQLMSHGGLYARLVDLQFGQHAEV